MQSISAKTIISAYKDGNSWFGNNYNMNLYKGCCHGCIYCDSRSECYQVENFDQIRIKENAVIIVRNELKSKKRSGVVASGAMTDPYNPFEKKMLVTRDVLELLDEFGYGSSTITKSALVTRDIDVFKRIKKHSPVIVKLTITTAFDELCKKVEPRVSLSSERFRAIKMLSDADIFTGIMLMPVLPFIEDTVENIVEIVKLAHENGARFIYPCFGVTLRTNQRDYFYEQLDKLFPGIKQRYINTFGNSYECPSPNASILWDVFKKECDRFGLLYRMQDIISAYKDSYNEHQISFF